jgi:serine/threonine protein kinase
MLLVTIMSQELEMLKELKELREAKETEESEESRLVKRRRNCSTSSTNDTKQLCIDDIAEAFSAHHSLFRFTNGTGITTAAATTTTTSSPQGQRPPPQQQGQRQLTPLSFPKVFNQLLAETMQTHLDGTRTDASMGTGVSGSVFEVELTEEGRKRYPDAKKNDSWRVCLKVISADVFKNFAVSYTHALGRYKQSRAEDEGKANVAAGQVLESLRSIHVHLEREKQEYFVSLILRLIGRDFKHIVRIFGLGTIMTPVIVMERMDTSLCKLVQVLRSKNIEPSFMCVLLVGAHVARGLQELATANLLHLDVSPQNVLVDLRPRKRLNEFTVDELKANTVYRAALCDFGLARYRQADEPSQSPGQNNNDRGREPHLGVSMHEYQLFKPEQEHMYRFLWLNDPPLGQVNRLHPLQGSPVKDVNRVRAIMAFMTMRMALQPCSTGYPPPPRNCMEVNAVYHYALESVWGERALLLSGVEQTWTNAQKDAFYRMFTSHRETSLAGVCQQIDAMFDKC